MSIYMSRISIYVEVSIYMSKCQYICRNVDIYVQNFNMYVEISIYMSNCNIIVLSLQIYVQVDICGSRFILPRFNVIFDIYIADEVSTYIFRCKLMQMRWPVSREELKTRLLQSTTWRPKGFQRAMSSSRLLSVWYGSQKSFVHQSSWQCRILVSSTRGVRTDTDAFYTVKSRGIHARPRSFRTRFADVDCIPKESERHAQF